MTTTIAFTNQKGGVGKTSVTLHVGGTLSEMGYKTLLVDLDQQGNLSSVFLDNVDSMDKTIVDLFMNGASINEVRRTTNIENLDILPANLSLVDLDLMTAGDDDAQYMLIDGLSPIRNEYDFILIDCPPNLGRATRMAYIAANYLIIPIECKEWAVRGSNKIMSMMEKVKKRANPDIQLMGFIINLFDSKRVIEQQYNRILRQTYGSKVFKTEFRNNVQYTESVTARTSINYYSPSSEQAEAFRELAKEIISHVKIKK